MGSNIPKRKVKKTQEEKSSEPILKNGPDPESIQELIHELENNKSRHRYQIRSQVYDKIKANLDFYSREAMKFVEGEPDLMDNFKRIKRMIAQLLTEERIKMFSKIEPVVVAEASNSENLPSKSTNINIIRGNIFLKKELWDSSDSAIVIPGSNDPWEVCKSATECLETSLTRSTSFLKVDKDKVDSGINTCYCAKVTVVRMEHDDGTDKILPEGETGKINIIYCVTSVRGKPKSSAIDFETLLKNMFVAAKGTKIKHLYIPPIGCGQMKKSYDEVSKAFRDIFQHFKGWVENITIFDKEEINLANFMIENAYTLNSASTAIGENRQSLALNIYESTYNTKTLEAIPIYESQQLNN